MAVLQIEIAKSVAVKGMPTEAFDDREKRLRGLLYDAVRDTLKSGGTFTLVVGKTHITAVQLETAVALDDPE